MMSGGFAAMFLGIVLWAGFFTLLVWAIYTIAASLGTRKGGNRWTGEPPEPEEARSEDTEADSAEELLRKRFARGEIDTEEYDRILATLNGEKQRASVS